MTGHFLQGFKFVGQRCKRKTSFVKKTEIRYDINKKMALNSENTSK